VIQRWSVDSQQRVSSSNNTLTMTQEEVRLYCLAKAETTEELPFDDITLVYKVAGKMFALVAPERAALTVKCAPERALELRAQYEAVEPAYHFHKRHWIMLPLSSDIPKREVLQWINDSYTLVVAKLPKAVRERIAAHQSHT